MQEAQDRPAAAPQANGTKSGGGPIGAIGGAIAGAIGGLLIAITVWILRRSAIAPVKIDPATGGIIAEFSRGLRVFVAGCSLFTPTALLVAAFFLPRPESAAGYGVLAGFILLFAMLGASVCWTLFKARFIAHKGGLISESGWRSTRKLAWSEVLEVAQDKGSGGLLFRGPSKKKTFCISPLMAGLKPLAAVMRSQLPAEKYQHAANMLRRIDQLENGNALMFAGGLQKASTPKAISS